MPSRIDLAQFWRDHPEYLGKEKEFGIYGATVDVAAAGAQPSVTPIPIVTLESCDFIATAIYQVPFAPAGNSSATGNPTLSNLYLPSQRKVVNTEAINFQGALAPERVPSQIWSANGFAVSWDFPYPILIKATGVLTYVLENPNAFTMTVNVALHGVKVFL